MEELENLKAEGWIEYTHKLSFKVLDENGNIAEQQKYIHLYRQEGKIVTCKAIPTGKAPTLHTTLPFK